MRLGGPRQATLVATKPSLSVTSHPVALGFTMAKARLLISKEHQGCQFDAIGTLQVASNGFVGVPLDGGRPLSPPQSSVRAISFQQVSVPSFRNDPPLVEDHDLVGPTNGAQSMSDDDDRLAGPT